ncbi:MAG: carbon starvation protein A [Syntrophomonadaceae bacterium]|nr:carbon starvation protein A [Syntrophomonadaceae bacterium]
MNPLLWLVGSYAILIGGHYMAKRPIEALWPPDPNRTTPAVEINNRDFSPNPPAIVFGHYYMSIAGLSPVLSAIAGLYWGWLPALIWMLVGVIILGATTEYITMMGSLRNKGSSFGEITTLAVGKASGIYLTIMLWFLGVLVFSIFSVTMSRTLIATPMATIPTIALTFIAVGFGHIRRNMGVSLLPATLIALAIWSVFIYIGILYPVKFSFNTWMTILVIYTLLTAYLPIWLILAPRDYLNAGVLVAGLAIATIALIIGNPKFTMPMWVGWETARGALYPAIFATITCGAINCAHSLITAGTASRMVENEKHAYPIVSAGTKGETVMALVAIALIASVHNYQAFTTEVVKNIGAAFSTAYGTAMGYIGLSPEVGAVLGALTLSGFIITTMDSYARAGRYCLEELARSVPAFKAIKFDVPVVSTLVTVGVGVLIALKTPFMQIWTAYALLSLTFAVYPYSIAIVNRVKEGKPFNGHFIGWVVVPFAFMATTGAVALLYFIQRFIANNQTIPLVVSSFLVVLFVLSLLQLYTRIKFLLDQRKTSGISTSA